MTPLPQQPPRKRRSTGAMPVPGEDRRQERSAPVPPSSSRPAPKLPIPKPPREEPETSPEEDYERLEGEDASFESVSYDEQERLDETGEEEFLTDEGDSVEEIEEPEQRASKPKRKTVAPRLREAKAASGVKNPERARQERSKRPEDEDRRRKSNQRNDDPKENPRPNFVDEENLEVKPYGRKKKTDAYVKEVDRRNNLRKKTMMMQYGALGLLALIMGFGFKNTVFPPPTLDAADVTQLIQEQTGVTGFPSQQGQGFATDFIEVWAQRGDDDVVRNASLAMFYGAESGSLGAAGVEETFETTGSFRQEVVYGPTLYEVVPLTENSERYVVGVGVSVSDTTTGVPLEISGEPNIQWRYFSVDVLHNSVTDEMSIVEGSPSIVPPYSIGATENTPERVYPGTGVADDELAESVRTTVEGFFSGYAQSSEENTSPIDQYISLQEGVDSGILTAGMNGDFELAGEDISESVEFEAFRVEEGEDSVINTLATVRWEDTVEDTDDFDDNGGIDAESASAIYESTYVMSLAQESEGRWVITAMAPANYLPSSLEE